jgi:hypothetical protein
MSSVITKFPGSCFSFCCFFEDLIGIIWLIATLGLIVCGIWVVLKVVGIRIPPVADS